MIDLLNALSKNMLLFLVNSVFFLQTKNKLFIKKILLISTPSFLFILGIFSYEFKLNNQLMKRLTKRENVWFPSKKSWIKSPYENWYYCLFINKFKEMRKWLEKGK